MTVHVLAPAPTPLDWRILDALPDRPPGVRLAIVARKLRGVDPAEIRRVLRGFEHLGHATGAGGWWRRT